MSRLLEQVREAVRTRHHSIRTEEAYLRWVREYILFIDKRHPSELGANEIGGFVSGTAQSVQEEREFKNTVPAHVPVKVKIKNEKSFKDKGNKGW